jgi:probable rRNA maturation factor
VNRIEVSVEEVPLPAWTGKLAAYGLKVLDRLHKDNWDLAIRLCDNRYIQQLNARYRNRDEPTDILSFALGETLEEGEGARYLPGDILISLDALGENARYFQVSEDEELRRLLIHGILHLNGMDHPDEPADGAADRSMLRLQEDLLSALGGERILPPPEVP